MARVVGFGSGKKRDWTQCLLSVGAYDVANCVVDDGGFRTLVVARLLSAGGLHVWQLPV